MNLYETVIALFCDPEGNPCMQGSDEDRRLLKEALTEHAVIKGWQSIGTAPKYEVLFRCRDKNKPHVTFEAAIFSECEGWEIPGTYDVLQNMTTDEPICDDWHETHEWQELKGLSNPPQSDNQTVLTGEDDGQNAAPISIELLTSLIALARFPLWAAFIWNDHNFQSLHKEAKEQALDIGVSSQEEAEKFLDELDQVLSLGQLSDALDLTSTSNVSHPVRTDKKIQKEIEDE